MPVTNTEYDQYRLGRQGSCYTPFIFQRHLWFLAFDYSTGWVAGSPCGALLKWELSESCPFVLQEVWNLLHRAWQFADRTAVEPYIVLRSEEDTFYADLYRVTPRRALSRLVRTYKLLGRNVVACR